MVNLNELYLLNLALDGRDIFMLPKFTNVHMTNLLGSSVYSALVAKGLMQDSENFTQEGAVFFKKVEQYKNAIKYVKIGPIIIGLYHESYAIALITDENTNSYNFKRIKYDNLIEQLYPAYPFLNTNHNSVSYSELNNPISYYELKNRYSFKLDNALYLSTLDMKLLREKKKDMVTNELLFHTEGMTYCYDFNLEKLSTCSPMQLQDLIKERVTL